ncbi:hypothetical protein BCAR13_440159 [Paraburkholderia caribensis]|nr:hypothetical protein BCAR13_440159 [Paraburkholderia caribensis]
MFELWQYSILLVTSVRLNLIATLVGRVFHTNERHLKDDIPPMQETDATEQTQAVFLEIAMLLDFACRHA